MKTLKDVPVGASARVVRLHGEGPVKREMNNAKWTWATIGWMTGWAYVMAFITFNLGKLITGGSFGIGAALAVLASAGVIFLLVRPGYKEKGGVKTLTSVEAAE